MLTEEIIDALLSAESKALATYGPQGLNVVPVSTIRVVDGKIWLVNYFFKKTLENILAAPQEVALVAWKGFDGFQVRASLEYHDQGALFEEAKEWVAGILPDRIVKGLLVLSPIATYNISPTAA